MTEIIKVVVDLPLRKLNKEFDYLLPDEFKSKIKIGHLVRVPFGRRKLTAFVTETNANTDFDKSKLKKIDSLLYQESFFDQELLKIFRWTAVYYHAYLSQVIKAALPPGITDKKVKKKKIEFLKLNPEVNNYEQQLECLNKRAPKQYLILKYMLENRKKEIKLKFMLKFAETSRQTVYSLIDKNLIILYNAVKERKPKIKTKAVIRSEKDDFFITKEDQDLVDKILNYKFSKNSYLLTTDNNKRRYNFIIKLLQKMIKQQQNVIILVPEIEKEYIFLEQLGSYFSGNIAFLHSWLSRGERFDQWQQVRQGKVQLAVGARSAIFAPFSKLDSVIILEENNESYKGQEHPMYHARQIAVRRLQSDNSILILESPFPSLESTYHALKDEYQKVSLKSNQDKVQTEVIDLKKEIENGNLSDLSRKLKKEIQLQLNNNNQVILFLNRRGSANYLICRKCGHLIKCDNCDISLNYHKKEGKLSCHYCGLEKEVPKTCPACGSNFISKSGVGTEKILEELNHLYPNASAVRVDSDLKEKEVRTRINDFKMGKTDILVGTSILIKNQFYDALKFLAVISADTALNSSDFRAAENNFFLLNQLKSLLSNSFASKYFIQTYKPDHYSIKSVLKADNNLFYQQEFRIRKSRNYPPCCRLLNIIVSAKNEKKAKDKSEKLSLFLESYSERYLEKLGAAPAVLNKIRNKYRWQLILKFNSIRNREYIIQLIEKKFITKNNNSVEIRIDVDPYQML